MRIEMRDDESSILVLDDEVLPCDVELKPGLVISKGCKVITLLMAIERRKQYEREKQAD